MEQSAKMTATSAESIWVANGAIILSRAAINTTSQANWLTVESMITASISNAALLTGPRKPNTLRPLIWRLNIHL